MDNAARTRIVGPKIGADRCVPSDPDAIDRAILAVERRDWFIERRRRQLEENRGQ